MTLIEALKNEKYVQLYNRVYNNTLHKLDRDKPLQRTSLYKYLLYAIEGAVLVTIAMQMYYMFMDFIESRFKASNMTWYSFSSEYLYMCLAVSTLAFFALFVVLPAIGVMFEGHEESKREEIARAYANRAVLQADKEDREQKITEVHNHNHSHTHTKQEERTVKTQCHYCGTKSDIRKSNCPSCGAPK